MTILGRYEIVDKLGTGSMGTVYRARDTVLYREVALKTIRTGVDVEPELRERFYREARACARLQHPSIVVVHDLGEIDRTAYIAMELLNGFDFRKLIDARADIPLPVRIEAMAQTCDALAHAHSHGIVHRDIKPSNLFLVDNRIAKVLDFGIARLPSSSLTVAGKILGTPNYMAPEQILVQPTDGRSDLFSAAVVFFEFLVFAHPFRSDVIPRRIVEGDPDSLLDYDSRLPAPLEKILARALAKDPDRRYRTGDEMAADLRAVVDALLQNASPTFSRVQLPSDREIRAAASSPMPSDVDASLLKPPPPGEDPHEWHLSELMRLIPEFEAAVGRRDVLSAKQACRQLEAIGSVDSRFADAVHLCRIRLDELEIHPRATETEVPSLELVNANAKGRVAAEQMATAAGGDLGSAPKSCGYCGVINRSAAVYCIQCGGRLPPAPPARPALPPEPHKPALEPAPIEGEGAVIGQGALGHAAAMPDSPGVEVPDGDYKAIPDTLPSSVLRLWSPPRKWISVGRERFLQLPPRRRWFVTGVAVAVLCLVLASIVVLALRPVPVQPRVARAVVKPDRAIVYREARLGPRIATLVRDDRVNVLKIPSALDQVWVQVQFVGPKVLRPGYMQISDLRGWESADPEAKLELMRLFQSGSPSDDEIRTETEALEQIVQQFPGSRAEHKAQVAMALLDLSVVQQRKNEGQPAASWSDRIESARSHLEAAKGDLSVSSGVDAVQRQIESLLADGSAGKRPITPSAKQGSAAIASGNTLPAQPKKASKKRIEELLRKATDFFIQRKLDEADSLVEQILEQQNDNQEAIKLHKKIEVERTFEELR
jgi:serine/threonine protein kinase